MTSLGRSRIALVMSGPQHRRWIFLRGVVSAGRRSCVGGSRQPIRPTEGADVPEYLIYFNQQWVGVHTQE
jgi:hypothetical protein